MAEESKNTLTERQLDAIARIDSLKMAIKQMNDGKDVSNIAMKLINGDLNQLKLQIENIYLDYKEIEK